MIYWKTIYPFCLAVSLLCCLASVQAAPQAGVPVSFATPVTFDPQEIADTDRSLALTKGGDASVKRLAWQNAKQEYQEALNLWPDNSNALYGLAKCSLAAGDQAKAVTYYRKAIYSDPADKSADPAANGFAETNTARLMEFALLLNKVGQTAEALTVYNHAAFALDYEGGQLNGGKPYLKVLLPELTFAPTSLDQVQYTSARLQALANTAIAHGDNEGKDMVYMREAVKLYPDSPVTQYYLGEALLGPRYSTESKAAFQKAIELGDEKTGAAAQERMKMLR